MKKEIQIPNAPAPIGPYSQAIEVNNILFISGQIAIEPKSGELVSGSVDKQTHQVMKNIKALLEAANYSLTDLVKCSIFIKSMNDFDTINKVYSSYLSKPYPARETVEVSKLPKDVEVEISAIATR